MATDTDDPFFVGFAISTYQCSGDDASDPAKESNWYARDSFIPLTDD